MPAVNDVPAPSADGLVLMTRWVAVGATLALIALGLAWELWWAPTGQRSLAIKVLPLVLPLPGLMKLRIYSYRAMSLLVWLYVTEGLVRGSSGHGPAVPLAWAEVGLCLLLFAACVVHVRGRLRRAGARPPIADAIMKTGS
ncbi:MAG: DUF2069 domain-containing protein [Burkholderiales bacterium]|nr:DUF2069 domain-containing protein [Burkholderiales bacterium]